ncbi:hypothetical protein BDV12DRAFT_203910 [Aspergillus spectabilis]
MSSLPYYCDFCLSQGYTFCVHQYRAAFHNQAPYPSSMPVDMADHSHSLFAAGNVHVAPSFNLFQSVPGFPYHPCTYTVPQPPQDMSPIAQPTAANPAAVDHQLQHHTSHGVIDPTAVQTGPSTHTATPTPNNPRTTPPPDLSNTAPSSQTRYIPQTKHTNHPSNPSPFHSNSNSTRRPRTVYNCTRPNCTNNRGRGFGRKAELDRHTACLHVNPGAFVCEYPGCVRVFNRGDRLRAHVEGIHGQV